MSRSFVGAMAVMVAAGFAGCAATSRAHAQTPASVSAPAPAAIAALAQAAPRSR